MAAIRKSKAKRRTLMRMFGLAGVGLAAAFVALIATGAAGQDAGVKELTPTGKLRVAIAYGPTPSALYTVKDAAAPAGYKGVTIDLSEALAKKLGVARELVPYLASGEIQAAAATGVWDVSFMPVDAERKKFVDFGNAYHLLQSTYLVTANSKIRSVKDANDPSVTVCGVKGTATFRANAAASPKAVQLELSGPDEQIATMLAGKCEAMALSRESLTAVAPKIPGSRVLDDAFLSSTTAVAVPKNKPAALAYVSAFIEEAKASGLVRKSFDAVGMTTSPVAPGGMKP
jgi:polar amino acid transport system substrate-binding protein